MTVVEVFHKEPTGLLHVATVLTPETNDHAALEYAWRWTQNIHDSWSMPVGHQEDYNNRVTRLAPLPKAHGRTVGLRSSMVGDQFLIDTRIYIVDSFGFKQVE